jgi:DNA-binding NarL/FixJ family response regulator
LEPEYDLVAIAEDGQKMIEVARETDPDLIIADITMPLLNGLDAIELLLKDDCRAKVVFLTMHRDATYAARALQAGASGFVLKHSASSELLLALREALLGKIYVTPEIAAHLENVSQAGLAGEGLNLPELTPRQREVLQLFAEGRSAKQVAVVLHISKRTAENHKARIMATLGLSSTAELTQYAIRHGIVSE